MGRRRLELELTNYLMSFNFINHVKQTVFVIIKCKLPKHNTPKTLVFHILCLLTDRQFIVKCREDPLRSIVRIGCFSNGITVKHKTAVPRYLFFKLPVRNETLKPVSYTHLRAHETPEHLV